MSTNEKPYTEVNMESNVRKELFEKIIEKFFLFSASIAILSLGIITLFIFIKGTPIMFKIGLIKFIFGTEWQPGAEVFGILPMIIGSIYITIGAVLVGVPIGIFTAIFLSEIAPESVTRFIRPGVELLAGIPSVVYGFFGLMIIVPIIKDLFGGAGNSLLAGIFILAVMILPTIVNISETSIRAVPREYKEGSLAMGASHIQTIFKVILPAAKSGILAGVILGIGRAIGETMAVILVAGNSTIIPKVLTDGVRTLTANIAMEMSYAFGDHQAALFGTGVVLFIFIMILNLGLNIITHKDGE